MLEHVCVVFGRKEQPNILTGAWLRQEGAAELQGKGTSVMELRVGGKYRLGRKIGGGSFGDIFLGKQTLTCKL